MEIGSFFLELGRWLIAHPPWLVGILVVVAAVLAYWMHYVPWKKRQWEAECAAVKREAEQVQRAETAEKMQLQMKQDAQNWRNYQSAKFDAQNSSVTSANVSDTTPQPGPGDVLLQSEFAEGKKPGEEKQEQEVREKVGRDFELRVLDLLRSGLREWLETGRAKLLYNVRIPGAQIDMLLLDTSGIYLIECKCWSGIVLGLRSWKYWFRISCPITDGKPKIIKDGQRLTCHAFRSPVQENIDHRQQLSIYLRKILERSFKQYKQLSVFDSCGNLEFLLPEEQKPDNWAAQYIWHGNKDDVVARIKQYDRDMRDESRLLPQDVERLYLLLKPLAE